MNTPAVLISIAIGRMKLPQQKHRSTLPAVCGNLEKKNELVFPECRRDSRNPSRDETTNNHEWHGSFNAIGVNHIGGIISQLVSLCSKLAHSDKIAPVRRNTMMLYMSLGLPGRGFLSHSSLME
jgi:hypothetical protein